MKIILYLIAVLLIPASFGCRSQPKNTVPQSRWQLDLSQSGGFTGAKTVYHLEEGGRCYRLQTVATKTDTVQAVRRLEPALVQSILKDLNAIGFRQIQLQSTGNMTLSIVFTESGKQPHVVSWGAGGVDVPKPLSAFYDRTLQQLRPYFNTVK